ncbi:MAG: T9SS type A sorting domain-containing protein [Chitinophagaceae bacterium]|nr:MAG: T9SS type A sorting domain-containing protein [Chitinophagaceae bacterium]
MRALIKVTIYCLLLLAFSSSVFSQVTDFSPKTIIAGNGSILTISGTGFGATRGGNAYVAFESIRPVKVLETDYVLWSNNEIKVKVPLGAGGNFTVVVSPTVSYYVTNLNVGHLVTTDAFSPTHISAGTGSVLTVTGSGFGPVKTANNSVEFSNAPGQGGTTIPLASDYVSWSDTKIEVKVPSGSYDGPVRIFMDNGTQKTIHPWLTIDYNVQRENNFLTKLYNQNGSGGYTFHLQPKLNSNNKAKAAFLRAFETWKCATGVNWTIGELASSSVTNNVVRILDDGDADVGAPGQAMVSYVNIGGVYYVNDISIFFSQHLSHYFKFSPNDPGLYDFESVALHTLGKAHNLGTVTNDNDVMYWGRAVNSTEKKSLSANDLAAGNYVMDISKTASGSIPPMVPLSPGACNVTYSYINSFSPASAKGGQTVTITGTDFIGITAVKFGNVPATSFTVVSPTTITAVVAMEGASGDIAVTGGGGVATATGFIYINRTPQTLSSPIVPVKTYGDADFDLGVTASTGLPVVYTSDNPAVATIVNNKIHIVSPGSVNITANQAGDATYAPVSKIFSIAIYKLDQTLSFPSILAKLTTDPDFELNVVASSGLAVSYSSSNPTVATIVNGKVHIVGTGTTTITAIQTGDSFYNAVSVSQDLRVSNLAQTMVFPEISSKKVNDTDFEPGATVTSGLPITYTSSNLNVATIVNNKVHIVGAGTTTITASQEGNLTYAGVSVQVVLTVTKLTQTIAFPAIAAKDVTAADFEPGASVNSGLSITYTSSNLNVATIVNNKIHIVAAGTTTITATQEGNAVYTPISASVNLTINKLAQSINLPQIATKTFNDADFDINATATSGLALTYSSNNTNVATILNNKIHIVGAGTASITATQSGNATYEASSSAVTLTVNKLSQTITFPQLTPKNHTDADFDLNATTSSSLGVTYTSSNQAVATILGGKVHIVAGGATVITASQAGNANINAAPDVVQNLDVLFTIPVSNFTVKTTEETCKTSNNGSINITATQIMSYTAAVTLNGTTKSYPFNSVLVVNNLESGTYNVCITVAGQPAYKQCFDLIVKEPKDLAVYSSIKDNGNAVFLKLEGGERYTIEINGELISTSNQEITLPLAKGNNIVKIASDKTCQGIITKNFLTSNSISLYPNPVKNMLNITTGGADKKAVKVEIHALDGRLVQSSQYLPEYGQVAVEMSRLTKGLYILTLTIGNSKTVHKVIKD